MFALITGSVLTSFHQSVNGKKLLIHVIHHAPNRLSVEYVVENAKLYTFYDLLILFPLVTIFLLETVLQFRSIVYGSLFSATLYYTLSRLLWKVHKESILVVASIGIQTKVVYVSGQSSTQFIPWDSVKDVIIHECIVKQRVLHYLSVLVEKKGTKEGQMLIPLLTGTCPRLSGLERIYCDIQRIVEKKVPATSKS